MKKALQLCGCGALLAAGFALVSLGVLFGEARREAREVTDHLNAVTYETRLTLEETRAVVIKFNMSLDSVNQASEQQRKYWFVLDQRMSRTLKSLDQLVQRTDDQLNGPAGALPELASAIRTNSFGVAKVLKYSSDAVETLNDGATPILAESADSVHSLHLLLDDPNWKIISGESAATMNSVNGAAIEWYGTSKDFHEAIHRATRPGHMLKSAFTWILTKGGSLRSLIGK